MATDPQTPRLTAASPAELSTAAQKQSNLPVLAPQSELVAATGPATAESSITLSPALGRVPVELNVTLPVRNFRVCHLLDLQPGRIVQTDWEPGDDLPLSAPHAHLAWTEFEVVDRQLAVRITRLK